MNLSTTMLSVIAGAIVLCGVAAEFALNGVKSGMVMVIACLVGLAVGRIAKRYMER